MTGARLQYEQALRISEAALGPDHPTIGAWRLNLASALRALGDRRGARAQYEQALQISEAALGPDHKQTRAAREALPDLAGDVDS
jgi:tetratricopeptide (TPR) repeat protein